MSEAGNMSLSLKIAGDGYEDFYPYELTLEEGVSRVYRAELTVFSKTRRERKNMQELLERNASLTISQYLAGGLVTRNRYLHGIITGMENLGVAGRGDSKSCFRHKIIVESELARLRHTSLNYSWYRKTPPLIIEEIISRYGIRGEFSDKYINLSTFSSNLMFEQTNISDLDFIRRIMNLYGISWIFTHGKVSQNGLGTAGLHFSEGSRFPQPLYEYSDKRNISETERFKFLNYNEGQNVWKIDDWRMESRIGVDGMKVTALYPEADRGSPEWQWGSVEPGKRYRNYDSLFHGYERGTPPGNIDADMKRIIEAQRLVFTGEQENCIGVTENILSMPGLIMEIGDYYGSGGAAKAADAITVLVTDLTLHVRAKWPRDFVPPPADGEPAELARVEFSAKDWSRGSEKRFCRKPLAEDLKERVNEP